MNQEEIEDRQEMVGCLFLVVLSLIFIALIIGCIVVGMLFGAPWGWLSVSGTILLFVIYFLFALFKAKAKLKSESK